MSNKIVSDPAKLRTSKFKPLKIIFDNDGFVIAEGIWEEKKMAIACRWHEKDGLGYPNGFGHQQWFLLPGETISITKDTSKLINGKYEERLLMQFISASDSPYILDWEDVFREIISYYIDNGKTISVRNVSESDSGTIIHECNENTLIVFHNLRLIDIPFFSPYLVRISEENVFKCELFYRDYEEEGMIASIVYNNTIPGVYNNTIPRFTLPLKVFLQLGYTLSDIGA